MRQVGIWLDKLEANGVILEKDMESFFHIASEIEFFNPKGGSRSKTKWGPQDVVQDSKYLEREKHQFRKYFEKIAKALENADQINIFGPAEAPEKLMAELENNYPEIANRVLTVQKADSITQNQFKALVKQSFGIDDRFPETV
ncbi:hypothetical protein [Flagellimonas zhangzhouensis]|uniref:Protein required for attachment to host cells n=1 Tax=Flagellimonas zhangzhouensis TaxID=1073328 RepID=A0A1H2Y9I1_9FLAO|nr:hypothetical protein [Allomuricauda zhangzhouensis]SDQ98220.1 hypothetical protein SAMN05216294_3049 [Allomuricauda zhangzhouensis]SDX01615.1 hypothetical protein SAMN04487892_2972 [Allomuricauda zhangzhouensis]